MTYDQMPPASTELLSPEDVAERLGLHVRTVRAYIRDGRLKAVKIGKQYRVAAADLAALTGQPVTPPRGIASVRRVRHVDVSSIVQIEALPPDQAMRITNGIVAMGQSNRDARLRIDTAYDEGRAVLKIILSGDVEASVHILKLIQLYLEP